MGKMYKKIFLEAYFLCNKRKTIHERQSVEEKKEYNYKISKI